MNVLLSREDRNAYSTNIDMDRFTYHYLTLNGARSNRLSYVQDNGTDYASYALPRACRGGDIKTGQQSGN